MPKELSQEELLKLVPYLKEELGEKVVKRTYVTKESSVLEKAVLEEGKKNGFPNPGTAWLPVDQKTVNILETEVELINKDGEAYRKLKKGELPKENLPGRSAEEGIKDGVLKTADPKPEYVTVLSTTLPTRSAGGEITDEVLKTANPKPAYIVAKWIRTLQVHRGKEIEHKYTIEVYKM